MVTTFICMAIIFVYIVLGFYLSWCMTQVDELDDIPEAFDGGDDGICNWTIDGLTYQLY